MHLAENMSNTVNPTILVASAFMWSKIKQWEARYKLTMAILLATCHLNYDLHVI